LINYNTTIRSSTTSSNIRNIKINYNNIFFINSNLSNTENMNGLFFPKGHGVYTSISFLLHNKYLSLSAIPTNSVIKSYSINSLPPENNHFSMLGGAQTNTNNFYLLNTGAKINYKGLIVGYGNWNTWIGPANHNSIILSNNAQGFYHYLVELDNYKSISKNLDFKFKYIVSSKFANNLSSNYYNSIINLEFKYKLVKIGYSKGILSGGYPDIPWSGIDASRVLIDGKNEKYWDVLKHLYTTLSFPESQLEFFLELGFPNRDFTQNSSIIFYDHNMITNLGFVKTNIFGHKNIFIGMEYFRGLNSLYYNTLPSVNIYDNHKYNDYSFKGRIWSAHSGPDSDDFLFTIGLNKSNFDIKYQFNYERHGVTYSFPPEVKFENRFNLSLKRGNMRISTYYESEKYEHYGFVDSNINVWNETYEKGSIQRTKTLIFSISYRIL